MACRCSGSPKSTGSALCPELDCDRCLPAKLGPPDWSVGRGPGLWDHVRRQSPFLAAGWLSISRTPNEVTLPPLAWNALTSIRSPLIGYLAISWLPDSHLLMMQNFLREVIEILPHHAQRRFDHLQHLSSGIQVIDLIGATSAEHERSAAISFARLTNETIVPPFRDQLLASCPILRLAIQWPVEKSPDRDRKHGRCLRSLPEFSQQIGLLGMEKLMFAPSEASG